MFIFGQKFGTWCPHQNCGGHFNFDRYLSTVTHIYMNHIFIKMAQRAENPPSRQADRMERIQ